MKISRVYIYLKFTHLFKSFFSNFESSKLKVEKKFKDQTKKKYLEFFGMCRTSFLVTLEYLKNKNPDKNELIICSYNLEEMVDIARLCDFKIKMIDINSETGVMDMKRLNQIYLLKPLQFYLQTCLMIFQTYRN